MVHKQDPEGKNEYSYVVLSNVEWQTTESVILIALNKFLDASFRGREGGRRWRSQTPLEIVVIWLRGHEIIDAVPSPFATAIVRRERGREER